MIHKTYDFFMEIPKHLTQDLDHIIVLYFGEYPVEKLRFL